MFEVFSRAENIHGVLIQSNKNQLVFAHDKAMLETGEVQIIPAGTSYELVSNEDAQQLIFESAPGKADGVSTESVLSVLIHREEALLSGVENEATLLALRALQMALDAFRSVAVVS